MRLGQLGALGCALGVICGAFGAHALEKILNAEAMEWWQTGTTYLWYNALGILALGAYDNRSQSVDRAVWYMIAPGILLFSGSLYLYAFTGFRTFGMITPIGGALLLIGWVRAGFVIHRSAGQPK